MLQMGVEETTAELILPKFGTLVAVVFQLNIQKQNRSLLCTLPWNASNLLMLAEDEELVTNALETIVNLAPLLDLRIFSSSKPSYIKMT